MTTAAPVCCPPLGLGRPIETADGPAWQWQLARNCCLTPTQCLASGLGVLAFNTVVGLVFLALGYPAILCFAVTESAFILACLWVYARHATDRETVTLQARCLTVEVRSGAMSRRTVLDADWVRITKPAGHGQALVSLSERGIVAQVGRYVRPCQRDAVTREIAQALRWARCT